jgi:diadenosine tetraphosphate (Ap4A) HIT family hydrolase
VVLQRAAQVTLGSLVMAAKSEATAFSDLPHEAFSELAEVTNAVEQALTAFTRYERINYLMLMMVDPNVHFHVIPRYSHPRTWEDIEFVDGGWPAPPRLDAAVKLDSAQLARLTVELAQRFR